MEHRLVGLRVAWGVASTTGGDIGVERLLSCACGLGTLLGPEGSAAHPLLWGWVGVIFGPPVAGKLLPLWGWG